MASKSAASMFVDSFLTRAEESALRPNRFVELSTAICHPTVIYMIVSPWCNSVNFSFSAGYRDVTTSTALLTDTS